jgi:hypothetical protein
LLYAPTLRVTVPNGRSSISATHLGAKAVVGGYDLAAGDQRQDRGIRRRLLVS